MKWYYIYRGQGHGPYDNQEVAMNAKELEWHRDKDENKPGWWRLQEQKPFQLTPEQADTLMQGVD